jgi:hypothetical protein
MGSFGFQAGEVYVERTQLLADGAPADFKTGGLTVDWATVTAPGADVTLPDGEVIKAGEKYIRYGETVARITASGKFGPHRTNANDGRELLVAGDCYVLNQTMKENDEISDHPGVLDGGRVWEARLLAGGANMPTLAQLKAAFPRLSYAKD